MNHKNNNAMEAALSNPVSAIDAQRDALQLAFGPVVFQCVRIAWKSGLLASLERTQGLSAAELADSHNLSVYAVNVVLESCLSVNVVKLHEGKYQLSKVGYFVLHDEMTQVNFDFVQDVCYRGLFDLEASLRQEKPLGLRTLGDWSTLYEGLSQLAEPERSSWFAFDHFYSDAAFTEILPVVFADRPKRLMDIGANTGKWAGRCLDYSAEVNITLVDLPGQLQIARHNLEQAGHTTRVRYAPVDILDEEQAFPADQDVIWMSQFLTCFSLDKIQSIFRRARAALAPGGHIHVLDTFWDRQRHAVSAYCLINTSPYFTAIASGNSKMYRSQDYIDCAKSQGLELSDLRDGLGICHSLMTFENKY